MEHYSIDEHELETTIVSFTECKIYTNPQHETSAIKSYFLLKDKSLLSKIIVGRTYKFKYKYHSTKWSLIIDKATIFEILDIQDCEPRMIEEALIIGFAGIENQYKHIHNDYQELFIDKPISGNSNVRLLIRKECNLIKQMRYDITYIKFYALNFYLVIDTKLVAF